MLLLSVNEQVRKDSSVGLQGVLENFLPFSFQKVIRFGKLFTKYIPSLLSFLVDFRLQRYYFFSYTQNNSIKTLRVSNSLFPYLL